MANTRKGIIAELVSDLGTLTGIRTATNRLLSPSQAREAAPYIGVILATEEILVEDDTAIRYGTEIDLVMLAPDDDIDELIDLVKTYLYDEPSIGALQIKIIGHEELTNVTEDHYSSARITCHVTYVVTKGAF